MEPVTVDKLLEGSCNKDETPEDDEELYKKTDCWEKAVADFEQKATERRDRAEGDNMAVEVIPSATNQMRPNPVVEKLKDVIGLLETRT
jgi:hypothetical protein